MNKDWDIEKNDTFDDSDMIKSHRLPLTKEQVWEAFLDLNVSGQNWIFNKIKEL